MTAITQPLTSPLSFEDAMKELEVLVRALEDGRMPLDDAVKSYERGTFLKTHCQKILEDARLSVETVSENTDGKTVIAPL